MKKLFAAAVIAVALPAFAGETAAPAETKPAAVKKATKKGDKKDVATAAGEETKPAEAKPAAETKPAEAKH